MTKNANLRKANATKNDEFYTQLSDIEKELNNYKDFFNGKVVYCNCDDPRESNFFKFFSMNFERLGLKKLITTGYKKDGHGVAFVYEGDKNGNRKVDETEIQTIQLEGNGGYETEECIAFLKEADVVVTNPPFSLFRDYVKQLMDYNKKFLIIGNMNAITYKEIFPYIKNNQLWLGYKNGDMSFKVPSYYEAKETRYWEDENGQKWRSLGNICWYTNIPSNKRNTHLDLYKKYKPADYPKYDNYDAIEVSKTCEIPEDYDGVMGVPITFLDKYCPTQFEIIGGFNGYKECDYENSLLCGSVTEYYDKQGNRKEWTGPTINKKPVYYRILIRKIK